MNETKSTLPAKIGGAEITRFNALRHGVLSRYTVLPWEDAAEYRDLVASLVAEHAPQGPTEEHLVEELAGILWRKRRLRLAEAAAYRHGLDMRKALSYGTYPAGAAFGAGRNHSVAIGTASRSLALPAIPYSTALQPKPHVGSGARTWTYNPRNFQDVSALRLDVYSPPQVLQIDGRLCHLVLAFLVVGDFTNSRAPSAPRALPRLNATTSPSASPLLAFDRLPGLSRCAYDRLCSPAISRRDEEGLLQLLGMSLPPCCRFHPAEVKEPHRSDFGSPMPPSPSG